MHFQINKIWHMKTIALLIKMNQKEHCFEKLKSHIRILKYFKDMAEIKSQSLIQSTFGVLLTILIISPWTFQ